MTDPIVVSGAGIGGLSAAICLAAQGRRVLVLEQNDQPGGKMSQVQAQGFRWDSGPSVITMRPVFEELFRIAGKELGDYLDLQPIDPLTRYIYTDGIRLDICRELSVTLEQIGRIHPRDLVLSENWDPTARADLETFMQGLVPEGDRWYTHHLEGPDDATSHIRSMLTDTSVTIPVDAGNLSLGTWQGIYIFEHRARPHRRSLLMRVLSMA